MTFKSVSLGGFLLLEFLLLFEPAFKLGDMCLTLGIYFLKFFELLLGVVFLLDGLGDLLFDKADFAEDGGLLFAEAFDILFEKAEL